MEPDGVSPLQHFVQAKRTVTSIFQQILDFMQEGADFVQETWRSEDLQHVAEEEQTLQIQSCSSKLTVIRDVLARRHMKVAFFGRTSNGKSTVINAMLRERVLPSGIGHTTNCFLSVEGTDEELAFLTTEDSQQKKNIETVNELAHALHMDRSLDSGSLVRVFWPKAKCALLRDDLVLMDSPGTDVTSELDSWIDKFCLDADVFVLVANSESTIMNTEKHFFHKVNEHISKPNIFILNNRWDASILEPEYLEQVRKQHLDRCVTFLVEELKVVDLAQAPDRIFFISAKEVLSARTLHSQRMPETGGALPEGFQERLREFQDFERTFEEFISQSAVKTKFEQHTIRAWQIMESVKSVMDAINITSAEQKVYSLEEREALMDRLEFVRNHLDFLTEDIKVKIKATAEEVASKVSNAIVEETRFLTLLADEFSADFCPEQSTVYKTKLVGFVEKRMTTKLDYRCSSSIYGIMLSSQTDIMNTICPLLPSTAQGQLRLSSRKFVIHYDLNFSRLCEDFAEDIDFHFSLGFASLVKRFLGPTKAKQALRLLRQKAQEKLAKSLATELVSLTPRASVGMLIVAGVVWRSVGWRAIVLSMSFYTLLYLYERLSWTNSLKEKVLKQQFVDYITDRLQVVSSVISSDCGLQVQQEMVSNFARMCQVVEKSEMELESEINRFSSRIQRLESVQRHSKTLRHKATDLASQLECFSEQYLQIQLDQD